MKLCMNAVRHVCQRDVCLVSDYFRQSSSVFIGFRVLALTLQHTSNGILPGQELWDCDPGWGDEVVYERAVLMCWGKSWRSLLQTIPGKDRWKSIIFLLIKVWSVMLHPRHLRTPKPALCPAPWHVRTWPKELQPRFVETPDFSLL